MHDTATTANRHRVMESNLDMKCQARLAGYLNPLLSIAVAMLCYFGIAQVGATTVELNSSGGTSATNGLHFYIDDTTHMQVRRLNNTGQVYSPTAVPPTGNSSLDNGIFIRANGKVYGSGHTVTSFTPTGGMYNTFSLTPTTPANPASAGVQQTTTANFGITTGPQVSVVWKYTTPLDFITAEVTLVIPVGYAISAANPVRYYHVFDTFLGGSDSGCGLKYTAGGSLVVGTYPPVSPSTTCTSSTSIPSGVSIVESFRERSGLPFSFYCASGWSTFFTGSTCSVLQSTPMNNTIATAYQDTGIGIEYDFSATGVYTFSYDFVVGSPQVPPYDHLEIQHDGTATLCPEKVTVLACTSATLPCSAASIVSTGTLTGNLTIAPATPAVTVSPTTFTLGSGATSAVVSLQPSAPGGAYVLSASGLSAVPLNGIKCYNTLTNSNSCALLVTNTPCVANFECLETSQATYNNLITSPATRNPLYTKLAGTKFKLDVVALQADGTPLLSYTAASKVLLELFDDSVSPSSCSAYSSPIASQALNFSAAVAGRITLASDLILPKAYSKLRCRVTDSNQSPSIVGCSSDDFSVRPVAPILSTNATAPAPGASATPIIKAAAPFTMTAATTPTDMYAGTLLLDSTKLSAQDPAFAMQQSGGVVGNLYATGTSSNVSMVANQSGVTNNASYSEVGYLYAAPGSFRDDSLTAVDLLPAGCAATNSCDCVTSTSLNANLADTLDATFRYGCSVGNKTTVSYGRFIPDHFFFTKPATFDGFCTAGGFIYMDQPFNLIANIEARNYLDVRTVNYQKLFGKAVVTPQMLDTTTIVATSRLSGLGAPAWNGGIYPFVTTQFTKLGSGPDGPYDALNIGLSLLDADAVPLWNRDMDAANPTCTPDPAGTSSASATACKAVKVASTKMRYGRVKLTNASGSELLALPLPLRLEYWNDKAGWNLNTLDTCTTLTASNFAFSFSSDAKNKLAACETAMSVTGTAPNLSAKLSAPGAGNNGWTDISLNLDTVALGNACMAVGALSPAATTANQPWLMFKWLDPSIKNPAARATFGVYKNANEFIYLREIH
ncbi:hypothetical protein BH11PSE12_BH11PSE12_13340 [soil metagenome]